jgi:hypothetical protein
VISSTNFAQSVRTKGNLDVCFHFAIFIKNDASRRGDTIWNGTKRQHNSESEHVFSFPILQFSFKMTQVGGETCSRQLIIPDYVSDNNCHV